VANKLPKLFIN